MRKDYILFLVMVVFMLSACGWIDELMMTFDENAECKKFKSLTASQGSFNDRILLTWELPCDKMYYMDIYRSENRDSGYVHVHHMEKDTNTYTLKYTYEDFGLCSAIYSDYCNVKFESGKRYYYYIITSPYIDPDGIGEVKSNIVEGYVR